MDHVFAARWRLGGQEKAIPGSKQLARNVLSRLSSWCGRAHAMLGL